MICHMLLNVYGLIDELSVIENMIDMLFFFTSMTRNECGKSSETPMKFSLKFIEVSLDCPHSFHHKTRILIVKF